MASGQGTVTLNFGAHPGNTEALQTFVDATISGTSKIEAYIMASDVSSDHNANAHRYIGLFLHLAALTTAGVGGTVYGMCRDRLTGSFTIRYVWTD